MKTKFINGVSSSPSMSLGLLVSENELHVQPDTDPECKDVIRPEEPDQQTKRKAQEGNSAQGAVAKRTSYLVIIGVEDRKVPTDITVNWILAIRLVVWGCFPSAVSVPRRQHSQSQATVRDLRLSNSASVTAYVRPRKVSSPTHLQSHVPQSRQPQGEAGEKPSRWIQQQDGKDFPKEESRQFSSAARSKPGQRWRRAQECASPPLRSYPAEDVGSYGHAEHLLRVHLLTHHPNPPRGASPNASP
ncbi:hypothetical protein JZ751_008157 [Albula glossodonta]|uniref:Uncharacterized protein n=1 Tax=Albula glossodonta TaxID=121402 RepID=A0A8T2ND42_9TELE|nr:hypothetical protein JZ751_008157 [Albula glossodonta]